MMVSVDGCMPTASHSAIELRQKKAIYYPGLVHYLHREGIDLALAGQYLKEIYARNRQTGNNFIALGLPTVDGGFGLRTAYLERYIGQPAISFIRGQVVKSKGILVFKEGMDFLCLLSWPSCIGRRGHCVKRLVLFSAGTCVYTSIWLSDSA